MAIAPLHVRKCGRIAPLLAAGLLACVAAPLSAQESDTPGSDAYLDRLRECQSITVDAERLACFDAAVGTMVAANDAGDLRVVDREDVRQTRRSLFGFSLPSLGIFGGDDDEGEEELFETTIESVRFTGRSSARITTAEGAVWEMQNVPRRRSINVGDTVVFKKASFGYYWLRIDGQNGIKGRRVG